MIRGFAHGVQDLLMRVALGGRIRMTAEVQQPEVTFGRSTPPGRSAAHQPSQRASRVRQVHQQSPTMGEIEVWLESGNPLTETAASTTT
jgi:hypothetical protein